MSVLEALVTMLAFQYELDEREFAIQLPRLKKRARKALREIGSTREEIDSEFPDECLYEGLALIKNDPTEFRRQARVAMVKTIGNN